MYARIVWFLAAGACACALAGCGRYGFDAAGADLDAPPVGDARDADDGAPGCPGFALLCDGFEAGDLSLWTGPFQRGEAMMTFTDAHVRSGALALEAQMSASAENGAAAVLLEIPAQATGTLAVRAWFHLARPLERFSLVLGFQNRGSGQYIMVGGDNDGEWVSTENTASQMLRDHHSERATPLVGAWTCVELVFTFPQAGGSRIQLFVDEVAVLDEPGGDASPAYTEIVVGGVRLEQAGAHLYVDDVVIARQRIGCP